MVSGLRSGDNACCSVLHFLQFINRGLWETIEQRIAVIKPACDKHMDEGFGCPSVKQAPYSADVSEMEV